MSLTATQIISSLEKILGKNSVIYSKEKMQSFLTEPRNRFHQPALAVLKPNSISQLQEIMRFANKYKIPIIPQGGNSGLVGGQVPLYGDELIVSLAKINKLRELNIEEGYILVEAGMVLQQVQNIAGEKNMLFPLSIGSKGSAQIGGILATNAGGAQVLSYGNGRELCLGIEAVLADGSLYNGLKFLRKDNSGYDLNNLLIGSEGSLAIITAAKLKIFPRPKFYETALIGVKNLNIAYQLFQQLVKKAQKKLTAFELISRFGIAIQIENKLINQDFISLQSPYYILAEISHFDVEEQEILTQFFEIAYEKNLINEDSIIAQSMAERNEIWQMREQMSESQKFAGASIKHDISVAPKLVPELIERGIREVAKINKNIRPCPFGHMGDGNIHFNFSQPIKMEREEFLSLTKKINQTIYDIVLSLDGSISAEHGIGQLKIDLLERVKDPTAIKMMKLIKNSLDPNNILNRGKVLKL